MTNAVPPPHATEGGAFAHEDPLPRIVLFPAVFCAFIGAIFNRGHRRRSSRRKCRNSTRPHKARKAHKEQPSCRDGQEQDY
jgi:hypothetical protein